MHACLGEVTDFGFDVQVREVFWIWWLNNWSRLASTPPNTNALKCACAILFVSMYNFFVWISNLVH